MTTVYQAISAVMGDVLVVRKDGRNQVQGFNFRGIDAVMNAVGPALRDHGVIVVPTVESSTYDTVIVGSKRTEMGHAQVVITYTWYGPEGDSIVSRVSAEAMDSGDKAVAKAHSVALRTAMIQTLALPTDEPDPDETAVKRSGRQAQAAPAEPVQTTRVSRARPEAPAPRDPEPPAQPPATTGSGMSDKQRGMMLALFSKKGFVDRDDRIAYVRMTLDDDSINSSNDLNSRQASRIIDALNKLDPADA